MLQKQGNDTKYRQALREAFTPDRRVIEPVEALSQLRASKPSSEFAKILAALKAAAPISHLNLTALGARHAWDLVWNRGALIPLDLKSELEWAALWLRGHSGRINDFRSIVGRIEALVVKGDEPSALAMLDAQVKARGWSLWAVELRAALLQAIGGTNSQRAWLTALQEQSKNSISGLLFQVFGDRNDDTFSYDAVYGKCQNSFPRFEALAPWLVDYLGFRSLGHVSNARKAFPGVLARDITSCLLDYYESVIECLSYLESDEQMMELRGAGNALIDALLADGFTDHRLKKLRVLSSDADLPTGQFGAPIYPAWLQDFYKYKPLGAGQGKFADICADVDTCIKEGAAAYELVGKLLKWGMNYKGLDVGSAIAVSSLYASTRLPRKPLPLGLSWAHSSIALDDAAACGSNTARRILRAAFGDLDDTADMGDVLATIGVGTLVDRFAEPGAIHLWWAFELQRSPHLEELKKLLAWLKSQGGFWRRKASVIEVDILRESGDLDAALTEAERWFRVEPKFAYEFPSKEIFEGRNWRTWKHLDLVTVANVAHYAFSATGVASIAYICKMACRTYLESGRRDAVVAEYESADDTRKEQLVTFLRDVWIEENLSMCHRFQSTAEVRVERMQVLQLLIQWDGRRASEYAEAIKALTFDQTLQTGLERINQTRVFVNESAITRWAEKELVQDYERWRRLAESTAGGRAVDDIIRQYASDPANDETLTAFADGKPTAADAMLIDVVGRLFTRFLSDPIDGLDTFLSLRIRHGSFKGTLLGPFEEQGLLYGTSSNFSDEAFRSRWAESLLLPEADMDTLVREVQSFSKDIRGYIDDFVNERIQIARPGKPQGVFLPQLSPRMAKLLAASLAERPLNFAAFLSATYFVFWKLLEQSLNSLRSEILDDLSTRIRTRIDQLIQAIRARGPRCLSLVTTLTTVSTTTISQCESVAEWFRLPAAVAGEKVELDDAIEIAAAATRNVYRAFGAEISVCCLPAVRLPLTTTALATITDCLFVAFENAWKHSGLGSTLDYVAVEATYDTKSSILTLGIRSRLSDERRAQLLDGELTQLRQKYLGELPLDLVSIEGGSGFPKLSRLSRSVPLEVNGEPFTFGVDELGWFTTVSIPVYEHEGVYEAYI